MQLTVALVGEDAAGGQALRVLARRGHHVAAVFSDSVGGAGATVADIAAKLQIPVRSAAAVRERSLASELCAAGVELLLNVHSLYIVDPDVLEIPRLGAFNLHPGPLPERAGLHAPGWALYEGAEVHGVTLHRMTAGVDEGEIAFIERFDVGHSDTALEVMMQCVRRGLPLVERLLDLAERGEEIPARAQDLTRRRWFGAGPPEGGCLSWNRPARRVADFVRACDYRPFPSPWDFPRCRATDQEFAIASAQALHEETDAEPGTVATGEGGGVLVAASDSWVQVDWLEVADQRVPAAEVLRPGQRLRPAREVAGPGER